ncbi:MAG: hypothetical protein ACKVWV_00625 [Planctomycetota bacterium]
MSDPSAETTAPRATVIAGVAFGLLLIGGAGAALYYSRTRELDSGALLAEHFDVGTWPFGLVVVESKRLPFGEELVRLVDPSAPVEVTPPPAPEEKPPETEDAEPPKFDWTQLAIPTPDRGPREVTIVWYPPDVGEKRVRELVQGSGGSLRDLPRSGGTIDVDLATLEWGGYVPEFVHRRTFAHDHTFADLARIDVTTPRAYGVMEMRWTRGEAGSKQHALALLEVLKVKPASAR